MKKIIWLILLTFALVSCGNNEVIDNDDISDNKSEFKVEVEEENIEDKIVEIEEQNTENKDEVRKIVDKISIYCTKYNISKCLPIESYSTIFLDEKHSVMKVNNTSSSYLLTKNSNEWKVSIIWVNNICETGSDSPDLFEYCKKLGK